MVPKSVRAGSDPGLCRLREHSLPPLRLGGFVGSCLMTAKFLESDHPFLSAERGLIRAYAHISEINRGSFSINSRTASQRSLSLHGTCPRRQSPPASRPDGHWRVKAEEPCECETHCGIIKAIDLSSA